MRPEDHHVAYLFVDEEGRLSVDGFHTWLLPTCNLPLLLSCQTQSVSHTAAASCLTHTVYNEDDTLLQ
jgi:hypothetical protein